MHPMQGLQRRGIRCADGEERFLCYAKPVVIGNDCWFGANVVVCPGVTIGDNCVIGAGSVVTRDIPANTFAAGAPARGFRPITEQDDIAKLFPELRQGRFSANIARSICSKSLVWGYSAMSG